MSNHKPAKYSQCSIDEIQVHQEPIHHSRLAWDQPGRLGLIKHIAQERIRRVEETKVAWNEASEAYERYIKDNPDHERDRVRNDRENAKKTYFKAVQPEEYSDDIESDINSIMLFLLKKNVKKRRRPHEFDFDDID